MWGTRRLIVRVLNVLLEGVPENVDVYKLCSDIENMEGVTLIHDVHVWTITTGNDAFTAHVLIDPSYQGDMTELLNRIQDLVHRNFGIGQRHHTAGNFGGRLYGRPPLRSPLGHGAGALTRKPPPPC